MRPGSVAAGMRTLLAILGTLVLLIASVVVSATGAAGQDLDVIVEQVELRGYYVQRGADADINELERIVAEADDAGSMVAIVILATEAEGGDDLLASDIFDRSIFDTVVVVSDAGVGAVSVFEDDQLADALDAALDVGRGGGSNEAIAEAFIDGLPGLEEVFDGDEQDADSGGGGLGFLWVLLVLVVIGGVVWFFVRRARRRGEGDDVEVARQEIREQLDVIANEIVENQDTVELSGNEQAMEHYRAANTTYADAVEQLESTTDLLALAQLNHRVDQARWQLEAAEALVEGRPVPPEPEPDKPVACFFDPTHKPGTEDAVVRTPAGDKEVAVCRECADKLRRGERPTPRQITVGGRRVPAAKAPQSHGGRGMGGLGMFEVVLGGLGGLLGGALGGGDRRSSGGVSLDWGEALGTKRSRRSSGVFGPDRLPPGGRGLGRSTSGRRSSGRRSSGRRSGGRSSGRVGRGRARGRF